MKTPVSYGNPLASLIGVAIALSASPSLGQDQSSNTQSTSIEEVLVWGRSLEQLGRADSASQGVVGYADFSTRPLSRVGELVEVVPG